MPPPPDSVRNVTYCFYRYFPSYLISRAGITRLFRDPYHGSVGPLSHSEGFAYMAQESIRRFEIPVLDRFISHCHIRHFVAKTPVVNAGDASNSLCLVISGAVAVIVEDEDGNEIVVAYLNRGEFFGEIGLFTDDPTRKVSDLAFLDVTGRIARTLLDLCQQPDAMTHPDGMQIRISRQEIGRIVGCSREMAGRVLKALEEQGLIGASGKTIVVFGARPDSDITIPLSRQLAHAHR